MQQRTEGSALMEMVSKMIQKSENKAPSSQLSKTAYGSYFRSS